MDVACPFPSHLKLVEVAVERGDVGGQTLARTGLEGELVGHATFHGVASKTLPVIEDALREGLTTGVGAKVGGEAEGLSNGQVSLDEGHRGTSAGDLLEHVATAAGEHTVDTTGSGNGDGDVAQVDGLQKGGLASHDASEHDAARRGHDLTHTTVDGVSVHGDVLEVEGHSAHLLVAKRSGLGGPLETSVDGLPDLRKVLDTLAHITEHVGAFSVGAESPDLLGLLLVEAVVGAQVGCELLLLHLHGDLAVVDVLGEVAVDGSGVHVQTVVLVGGLGQALGGLLSDGFAERHNRGRDLDASSLHEIVLKILQADLKVELTSTSNDVLAGVFVGDLDHRIGLGQALKAFDKLGKIASAERLDGNAHDRGHGELHDLDVVGIIGVTLSDGTGLENVLVNTNETASVTARNIDDLVDGATHHDDGTLDGLDDKIVLLSGDEVGTADTALLAGGDLSGEDTTEGGEAAGVRGGDHLGDVHHKRTFGVASLHGLGVAIVGGTFVEKLGTVALGLLGGGKVQNNHLHKSLSGGEPLLHGTLEEVLAAELALVLLEVDAKLLEHLPADEDVLAGLLGEELGLFHDAVEELVDGVQDEVNETTGELATSGGVHELLGSRVVVALTPQVLEHDLIRDTELGAVESGEVDEGETPLVKTSTERDGTLARIDKDGIAVALLDLSGLGEGGGEDGVAVRVDEDVDVFDDTGQVTVGLLRGKVELEQNAIELVAVHNGLDTLGKSLAEDGLGLDSDTLDAVNDDKSTIGDAESSSDLRREINVTGGVDQVDQVLLGDGGLDLDTRVEAGGKLRGSVLEVQGDTSGLDGNAALLLVGASVSEASATGSGLGDDTSLGDESVGKSRLTVVDVGDHRHVTDLRGLVHHGPHLVDGKVDHLAEVLRTQGFWKKGGIRTWSDSREKKKEAAVKRPGKERHRKHNRAKATHIFLQSFAARRRRNV